MKMYGCYGNNRGSSRQFDEDRRMRINSLQSVLINTDVHRGTELSRRYWSLHSLTGWKIKEFRHRWLSGKFRGYWTKIHDYHENRREWYKIYSSFNVAEQDKIQCGYHRKVESLNLSMVKKIAARIFTLQTVGESWRVLPQKWRLEE